MSDETPLPGETHLTGDLSRANGQDETIEVRLPPRLEYAGVLRAAVGVIAGGMSFNYDEIMQIRTALTEAFELAAAAFTPQETEAESSHMSVTFAVRQDRIEIELADPGHGITRLGEEAEEESKALLTSLVDELEMGPGGGGRRVIRMVIYKKSAGSQASSSECDLS